MWKKEYGKIKLRLFSYATKKEQADKHTRKETTKNNEGKQHRNKIQMEKRVECDHVKRRQRTKKAAKQNPSSI
jgi:hypothetical protein